MRTKETQRSVSKRIEVTACKERSNLSMKCSKNNNGMELWIEVIQFSVGFINKIGT